MWTAYTLATAAPRLRIVVVEAEIAGYGPSGRNGGFVSAGIAGTEAAYGARGGRDGVIRCERAIIDAIDEIGAVVTAEAIDCGYRRGGSYRIATSAPQLARVQATVASKRARGYGEDDLRVVSAAEITAAIRIEGVRGGSYTPHCARVDPGRLVRGLAAACERHGVLIHERTRAVAIDAGQVRTATGVVRADWVVRATESYTTRLAGERRRFLPISSHMIATEPLAAAFWDEVGWSRGETIADQRYHFFYAQRTPDDRIAIGGRGAPYRFASAIRERDEDRPAVHAALERALVEHFPTAPGAITHRWGGPFAVPRDWSMAIGIDRTRRIAAPGGLSGHGVVASNVCGRTVAAAILDQDSDLLALPWVDHASPRWEPEPLRSLGGFGIPWVLERADAYEQRTNRTARWVRLFDRYLPGR